MSERRYPYGTGKIQLVSTDWLSAHLQDSPMMILDAQPNVHDYIQEHIPGAVHIDEGLFREPLRGWPAYYIAPEAISLIFSRLGLQPDVSIVVYSGTGPFKGWGDGLGQTMVAYSLVRFGHNRVFVLDGGIDKWKAEGRVLTKGYPEIDESRFPAHVESDYFLTYEEFRAVKDQEDVIVLDARPPKFYEGQGPWSKPGHIPGAINLPWASLMDPNNPYLLKSDEEVQQIIGERGVTRDKMVICSCGTGREATNEFLLFKFYLGYPRVKLHEGAFTEWTAYPKNPTVVGKSPR